MLVYTGPSQRERGRKRTRAKISKQPPSAPTGNTVSPCPRIIQISRTHRHFAPFDCSRHPPSTKKTCGMTLLLNHVEMSFPEFIDSDAIYEFIDSNAIHSVRINKFGKGHVLYVLSSLNKCPFLNLLIRTLYMNLLIRTLYIASESINSGKDIYSD